MTLIADPDARLASPMYLKDSQLVNKQQDEGSNDQGVSKTGVAFIAVVCTLAVVAVALVAYVVSTSGNRNGTVVRALASHQCGPGSIPGLVEIHVG